MEIIPKEKSSKLSFFNTLFYFALFFLLFSIIGFFLLNHFLGQVQNRLTELEAALVKKVAPEKLALKQEVLNYQEKIDNFSILITQRLESLKFFTAFEKIVHPQVWFSEFSLNSKGGIVVLSGQSQSFEALEQQLSVIKDTEWIKDFKLETVSITEEKKIDFSLIIFFDPKILK
jgi:hypothetical protein